MKFREVQRGFVLHELIRNQGREDLEVGKTYRMRPTSYIQSLAGVWHAHKISELFFSNVRDRLTADPPAVEARFILNPAPYMQKSERELVINYVASGDAKLFSLNETYHVIVPPVSHEHEPTERMLSDLRDKRIWTPPVERHCPDQEALAWHREVAMRQ